MNKICGAIINTVTFFNKGKLAYALSRQSITGELLKSGFSPWIQSRGQSPQNGNVKKNR